MLKLICTAVIPLVAGGLIGVAATPQHPITYVNDAPHLGYLCVDGQTFLTRGADGMAADPAENFRCSTTH
ncbi:MAG TPA: hypothetical protein VHO01_16320 [Jatrophihabitans sp.]|nr:hypothetical protein [Jatrophihabitans sp.]